MKSFYCGLLLLCACTGIAQPLPPGLDIGDHLPLLKATKVLNHAATSINTRQFKGKLLILDFMRTTCGGCLTKLDDYQQLQQQYSDRLAIVLVTPEAPAVVKAYMKRPHAKPLRFPIITGDQQLNKLFPNESVTHLVWIDSTGKVKAITEGDWLTPTNVETALNTDSLPWPVKRDVPFFDYTLPIVVPGEQVAASNFRFTRYSALLPYLPDVPSHFIVSKDSAAGTVRWQYFNQSIIGLYTRLYNQPHWPLSRIVLEVQNKQPFFYLESYGPRRAWQEKYALNCEVVVPFEQDIATARRKAQQQLDAMLGLKTGFEKRKLKCLVIKAVGSKVPPSPEGIILWDIADRLNNRFSETPVLLDNDSLIYLPVAITPLEIEDDRLLRQRLQQAGYQLIPETREIDMFIIREISSPN